MERRGFLQALGAVVGGLVVAPTSILLPHTPLEVIPSAAIPSLMPLSDTWMTKEVLRLMQERLKRTFTLIDTPNLKLGSAVQVAEVLRPIAHQFNVSFRPFPTGQLSPDEFRQRYLQPIASTLAQQAEDSGVRAFAEMETDFPGCESVRVSSRQSGMSLRLIRQYDVMSDQMLSRFDMLAA